MRSCLEVLQYCGLSSDHCPAVELLQITQDSRLIAPGTLFVAVQGHYADGYDYIESALHAGAPMVLSERAHSDSRVITVPGLSEMTPELAAWFYHHPSQALTVVAVTGTNGKTSVCHLLVQMFSHMNMPAAYIGTLGYGLWPHLQPGVLTTPDCCEVQRYCREALDQGATHLCIEASSHGLTQQRLAAMHMDVAVFTQLTQDHLDYHGSMSAYAEAKSRLFCHETVSKAVLNGDDPVAQNYASLFLKHHPHATDTDILFYGEQQGHFHLQACQHEPNALTLTLMIHDQTHVLRLPLLGEYNAWNIMAALAVCETLGIESSQSLPAAEEVVPPPGRMQVIWDSPRVIVDFAHTPDAMRQVLNTARQHCHGTLWVVFGCGGDRDRSKRPQMAAAAEAGADRVILTEDNVRFESPEQIFSDVIAGFKNPGCVILQPDRRLAIQHALSHAEEKDFVLLLGKGHEQYLECQGKRQPFSEERVVKEYWETNTC